MKKTLIAISVFLIYLQVQAQPEIVLLKTADSLAKLLKFDAAIGVYSKILKQKPQYEPALKGRGRAYLLTDKLILAEKDYKGAISINPACVDCHIGLGKAQLLQNNIVAARLSVGRALQLDDKSAKAYQLSGRINMVDKKYREASSNLSQAITLDSSDADAFYWRAMLMINTGLEVMALGDLASVNKLAPDFAMAYYQTGVIYANQKKWTEALNFFTLSVQKDSTNAGYYKSLANVYAYKKDLASAVRYYTKSIKLDDKDVEAYVYRAGAYYSLEDMDASCSDYKLALKIAKDEGVRTAIASSIAEFCDSSFAEYYYQRGIASYNLHNFERSIEWYNKGLIKFTQHCMLTTFRGNAFLAMKQYEKAESDYTKALSLKNNLAEETNISNSYKDATEDQKKEHITNSFTDMYRHRAEARLALNNIAGAMTDIDEALKIMPADYENKEWLYNIKGQAYLAQEDNNTALSWFNKALQAKANYAAALVNRAIVKINLAYKTSILRAEIMTRPGSGLKDRFILPPQSKTTMIRDNIESALSDCNQAITAEPTYAYAFYIRGIVKMNLEQADFCTDLLKSEQLGFALSRLAIEELKCK